MPDQTPEASRPSDLPAVSKLAAGNALRERMKNTAGLAAISAAAAGFIYDFFEADASAISVLKGDWYRTLVTVGEEVPGQVRHEDGATYPTSEYPTVTRLLRSGSGYVASLGSDGGVPESQRGRPHYTGNDLVSLVDLARQIGYRVGPAVKAQDALDPTWWPASSPESDGVPDGVPEDREPDPLA